MESPARHFKLFPTSDEILVKQLDFERKTSSGFYKYEVELPMFGPLNQSFDNVYLTVWSRQKIKPEDMFGFLNRQETNKYLLCSGFAANPNQFDRANTSFIGAFDEKLSAQGRQNSVFIGLSCPGFTGTKVRKSLIDSKQVNSKNVSVNTYADLIEYVVKSLSLQSNTSLIGHSAGGAAALEYQSRLLRNKLHLFSDAKISSKIIALNPAIHINQAKQFNTIKNLLIAKDIVPGQRLKKIPMRLVVQWLLGLEKIKYKKLSESQKKQVDLHVDELLENPELSLAKLDDLSEPMERTELTRRSSLIISGTKDRITLFEDINKEYGNVFPIDGVHHDDIFIDSEIQDKYLTLMIDFLINDKIP
jgi:pimeloyl-ACP methyl ester carboxylesterase